MTREDSTKLSPGTFKKSILYTYIRWVDTPAPKCGTIGAFLPHGVMDMDETLLSVFGNQTKLAINDIKESEQ